MADRYPENTAILLLAHGTPETLDDIPAYLRNVVSGRPMPDHVVEEIRHRYALIGKSPSASAIQEYSNELQVTGETPPTFIVHAEDDKTVPVANSIHFYESL